MDLLQGEESRVSGRGLEAGCATRGIVNGGSRPGSGQIRRPGPSGERVRGAGPAPHEQDHRGERRVCLRRGRARGDLPRPVQTTVCSTRRRSGRAPRRSAGAASRATCVFPPAPFPLFPIPSPTSSRRTPHLTHRRADAGPRHGLWQELCAPPGDGRPRDHAGRWRRGEDGPVRHLQLAVGVLVAVHVRGRQSRGSLCRATWAW